MVIETIFSRYYRLVNITNNCYAIFKITNSTESKKLMHVFHLKMYLITNLYAKLLYQNTELFSIEGLDYF